MRNNKGSGDDASLVAGIFIVVFILGGIGGCMYVGPQYNVWNKSMEGQAELAQADYSKQVAVQAAKAKQDSAQYEAQAEIIRAGGVAKANEIIGKSLENNEAYLKYLWIHTMEDTHNQVIYVPTETNLPILEAAKRPVIQEKP